MLVRHYAYELLTTSQRQNLKTLPFYKNAIKNYRNNSTVCKISVLQLKYFLIKSSVNFRLILSFLDPSV